MSPFTLPLLFIAVVYVAMIYMNERYDLFSVDGFPSPIIRLVAYLWLGALLFTLGFLIVGSSLHPPSAKDLAGIPFYSLFTLHALLIVFLLGWWLLARRPPVGAFLNIPSARLGEAVMTGFAVGVGGWVLTLGLAIVIALILRAAGVIPKNPPQPPPMIAWMAALPLWKKGLIVFSAMTVEEAFFRGWLQKRIGLIASTLLFSLAHSGLGEPLLLIGVAIISLVIGFTFYRTKNLIPGMMAHGIFDSVQIFVLIPIVFKLAGMGA
jgi:membrane protease YdiL (CAAX protease family)